MCSRKRQGVLPSRFMDGMKLARSESLRSIAARTSKYTYQVISKSRNIRGRTGSGRKKIYESVSRNGEFRVRAGNDGAALLSIATLRPSWKTLIEEGALGRSAGTPQRVRHEASVALASVTARRRDSLPLDDRAGLLGRECAFPVGRRPCDGGPPEPP